MNDAHLHLMLTHLPVVGILGVILVIGAGLWFRQEVLQRLGLVLMVLVGILAGGAYLTGEGAEEIMERRASVVETSIEEHEDVAKLAMIGGGLVAVLAAGILVTGLRRPPRREAVIAVLVGALVVSGLMTYTANLGGRIGHPEAWAGSAPVVEKSGPAMDRD